VTKVKQPRSGSTRATGRNGAKSAKSAPKAANRRRPGSAGTKRGAGRGVVKKKSGRQMRGAAKQAPVRTVKVRPLNPKEKCGPGTSVERLFRVDESVNGTPVTHLVFFDRHGLYCEHGRTCPAVDDVRRANRNLDWTRKVG